MQRTFRETKFEALSAQGAGGERFPAFRGESDLTWDAVLKNPRVLLVAEAGSGKSHECREQAKAMFDRGEAAFFVRLEHLAAGGLRESLRKKQRHRFDGWQTASAQQAYFFLDSVDELQLVHVSFRHALERLADDLEGVLSRAVIVVTSRPVPIDRNAFLETLPVPPVVSRVSDGSEFAQVAMQEVGIRADKEDTRDLREFELLPLDDRQIVALASQQRVDAPADLLKEIQARSAYDFVRWPQELIELCDDWRAHGEIRCQRLQMESHVQARLKARLDRREQADLSPALARQGAQRLALAVLLCRRWSFRYSAVAHEHPTEEQPVDPSALLAGWDVRQVAALLERPLFGDGGYGRVQFRHRSVLEYLAACQLQDQIDQGTLSLPAAKRLLVGLTGTNEPLTKPAMRPVAAWLSLMNQAVFEAVVEVDPATLLVHGDPESLELGRCQRALIAYVDKFGTGQWRGLDVPRLQVAKLARQPLGGTISSLWERGIENPEVLRILLRIAAKGLYSECANFFACVASDVSTNASDRFEAISALLALGDPRGQLLVDSAVTGGKNWPAAVGRLVCTYLFPRHVNDDQFLRLVEVANRDTSQTVGYANGVADALAEAGVDDGRVVAMLPRLTALADAELSDDEDEDSENGTQFYACKVLRAACIRLLAQGNASDEVLRATVVAVRAGKGDFESRNDKSDLPKLLAGLGADRRRAIFDEECRWFSQRTPDLDPRQAFQKMAFRRGAVAYRESDSAWIWAGLSNPEVDLYKRAVLMHFAITLAPRKDEAIVGSKAMRRAVRDSLELTSLLEAALAARKPDPRVAQFERQHQERQARLERKRGKQRKFWLEFHQRLSKKPLEAMAPAWRESTVWNLHIALRNRRATNSELHWDRAFVEKHFGRKAADEIRRGLMAYWRSMRPTVRSERASGERDTYLVVWSIGLIGIYAEAEDASWSANLAPEEVELVARYAFLDVGGFPGWMEAFARSHSAIVERVLGTEVEAELAEVGGSGRWHSMSLQSLQYGRQAIAKLLQGRLFLWLQRNAPRGMGPYSPEFDAKLEQVTRVLLTHGADPVRQYLTEIAQRQICASDGGLVQLFWFSVLCQASPGRGVTAVLTLLQRLPVSARGMAIDIIGTIFSERSAGAANWRVGLLAEERLALVRAINRHVRQEDDPVHEGAYSPGNRDRAQDARRIVFEELMDAAGPLAWKAKMELARDGSFQHLKDRIEALAIERLAEEIDASFFEPEEVGDMLGGGELTPKTGSDMAKLLMDRLDDLQHLMLRDTSPRAAWAMVNDENSLRPAIAREFEVGARGAYTVDQEAVTAEGKETDIRLRATSGFQATIELKIGEKDRSALELRDTIQDQLVDKYMAHRDARVGCLLVTVAKADRTWRHPDHGGRIGWLELQRMLDEAALKAQARLGGDARVIARVLNLTPRLPTEAASRRRPKVKK